MEIKYERQVRLEMSEEEYYGILEAGLKDKLNLVGKVVTSEWTDCAEEEVLIIVDQSSDKEKMND